MKILITGFPHSGTTIIRELILKSKKTEGPDFETKVFKDCKADNQVIKWPFFEKEFINNQYYKNANKIFLIRNPKFSFSSIKRRNKMNRGRHRFDFWAYTAQRFIDLKNTHMWHCYRYEDIFENNITIITFLESLKLQYDINPLLQNFDMISKPLETDHVNFRNWQIKQKIENKNFAHKLTLTKQEEYYLENLEQYKILYGEDK